MYAVRKSNGKTFTPDAESVCRIEEGSTNEYLTHDRAIEEFLKGVEPQYNAVIRKLFAGEIDPECIAVIAGFAAYVMTYPPAAMRIQSAPLEASLKSFAGVLDSANALPLHLLPFRGVQSRLERRHGFLAHFQLRRGLALARGFGVFGHGP
jgi:hypothetical protein